MSTLTRAEIAAEVAAPDYEQIGYLFMKLRMVAIEAETAALNDDWPRYYRCLSEIEDYAQQARMEGK